MSRSNKTSSVLRLIGTGEPKTSDVDIISNEKQDRNGKNNTEASGNTKFLNSAIPNMQNNDTDSFTKENRYSVHARNLRRRKTVTKNLGMEKLVGNSAPNPTIRQISTDEAPVYRRQGNDYQIVNVSAILINEQLGLALERFNSCACDTCCRIITEKAMLIMPDRFVHVTAKKDEERVNAAIKELRPEAVKVLTKLCITARTRPYHEYNN